jgi:hypothetical protein
MVYYSLKGVKLEKKSKTLLQSLRSLFFPESCKSCDNELLEAEDMICTQCRHTLPLTDFLPQEAHCRKIYNFQEKTEIVKIVARFLLFFSNLTPLSE